MPEQGKFTSQFVHVWSRKPVEGKLLENASVQQLGDRTFIVGQFTHKEGANDARTGLTAWIPVENVLLLTEYPNRKRLEEVSAQCQERDKANAGS